MKHDEFVLRYDNKELSVRINNIVASSLYLEESFDIARTAKLRFVLIMWASVALFAYSVYLSFTVAWYLFILGFVLSFSVIHPRNLKALGSKFLVQALEDEEFYWKLDVAGVLTIEEA